MMFFQKLRRNALIQYKILNESLLNKLLKIYCSVLELMRAEYFFQRVTQTNPDAS